VRTGLKAVGNRSANDVVPALMAQGGYRGRPARGVETNPVTPRRKNTAYAWTITSPTIDRLNETLSHIVRLRVKRCAQLGRTASASSRNRSQLYELLLSATLYQHVGPSSVVLSSVVAVFIGLLHSPRCPGAAPSAGTESTIQRTNPGPASMFGTTANGATLTWSWIRNRER
jgi:hypothetical protein